MHRLAPAEGEFATVVMEPDHAVTTTKDLSWSWNVEGQIRSASALFVKRSPRACSSRRGASRQFRPRPRRSSRTRSGSDPPDEADEPPPEPDLADLRGFAAANERLFRHVERRIGSRRAAA
jgi:hypothetical protein